MIPKKIHYCWFGGNPLPKSAQKCISSWKKFFPGYEIIEWNESNYDVNKISYTAQAYAAKKFAFVSDYARFDILYNEGGIYFDTDVEVIKSFDDILKNGSFMGCEIDGQIKKTSDKKNSFTCMVAPGLGIAAEEKMPIYKDFIDFYKKQKFLNEDGTLNTETVVVKITDILIKHGLEDIKGIQKVGDITIYPKEYFNPKDNTTGKVEITENTHSIHWYSMTWLSVPQRLKSSVTRVFHRMFGADCFSFLRKN